MKNAYKNLIYRHLISNDIEIRRADWIRTSDPYVPNVVRYRAALLPENMGCKNTFTPSFIKKEINWLINLIFS
jgi:hypothetical protein